MPKLVNRDAPECWIGVDPGISGGLAALGNGDEGWIVSMPPTERDVWRWFDRIVTCGGSIKAVIEKVGGYVPGSKGNIGSAMFRFGQSYGFLRACLTAAGIPFEEVTPQKWQRGLGIAPRKRTESKGQWKNRLKGFAQRLFPQVNVTLGMADALLIATYAQRKYSGTL